MSSMLIGMLEYAGISAYPVLIRTIDKDAVDPDFPMQTFNHAIVYVPLADTSESWTEAWPKDTQLGRGLWIDPTWDTCSIRELPWTVQGVNALVVTPDKGYMSRTPVFAPRTNLVLRLGSGMIEPNGDLGYEGRETFSGNPDILYKASLQRSEDRKQWIRRFIGNRVPRCNLKYFKASSTDDLDTPLTFRYGFTANRFLTRAGDLAFFRPNVLNVRPRNPFTADGRVLPVFYRYLTSEADSLTFHLPSGYAVDELPKPIAFEAPFGSFKTTYLLDGDTLIYTRKLRITKREIPAGTYETLKAFYKTIIRSDKAQVMLKRKS